MIRQYNKIAIGNPNVSLSSKSFTLRTNTNFEVKNAILFLTNKSANTPPFGISLQDFLNGNWVVFDGKTSYPTTVKLKLSVKNRNEILIEVLEAVNSDVSWIYVEKFIVTS